MACVPLKVSNHHKLVGFKSDYIFIRYACADELKTYDRLDFGLFGRSWVPIISWAVIFVPGVKESNWRESLPPAQLNSMCTGALVDVVASGSTRGNYRAIDRHGGYETAVHDVRTTVRLKELKFDRRVQSGGSLLLQINLVDPKDGGDIECVDLAFDGQVFWNLYSN